MAMNGAVVGASNVADFAWTRVDARALETADVRDVDRTSRAIGKRNTGGEADELTMLCIIDRRKIWRELGRATIAEYIEEVFGHGPKVGYERLRVARALEKLPEMREAFATGEVGYSALRELTRVATEATQQQWLDSARGRNLREIEDVVRTHRKGELPTDPPTPDLAPVKMQLELSKAAHALIRHARNVLADTRGHSIDDEELYSAMATNLIVECTNTADAKLFAGTADDEANVSASDADLTAAFANDTTLTAAASDAESSDASRIVVVGTAKHQIRTMVCERCEQTFFEGGGRMIAVTRADAEMAQCDAQRIGPDQRATQDVSPATRRAVGHRDHGKCCVPGCRSSRFLDVHHVLERHRGGNHDARNLTLICVGHHQALHRGKLTISGTAPNLTFKFTDSEAVRTASPANTSLHVETPPDAPGKYALAVMKAEAKQALAQLGFKGAAGKFVEMALQFDPNPGSLEELIRTALKCSTS